MSKAYNDLFTILAKKETSEFTPSPLSADKVSNATTLPVKTSSLETENDIIPTSAVSFIETEHGRMRREQRAISKRDLQSAKKYGGKFITTSD